MKDRNFIFPCKTGAVKVKFGDRCNIFTSPHSTAYNIFIYSFLKTIFGKLKIYFLRDVRNNAFLHTQVDSSPYRNPIKK